MQRGIRRARQLPLLTREIPMPYQFQDRDGNTFECFVNEWSQRKARCIEGSRKGAVIDDPNTYIMRPEPRRPECKDTRSDYEKGIDELTDYERQIFND